MPGNDGRSFLPINNKHTGHAALHVHVCATGNSWKSMLACLCNTLRYVCRVGYTSFNECATAEAAACEYSLIDVRSRGLLTTRGSELGFKCSLYLREKSKTNNPGLNFWLQNHWTQADTHCWLHGGFWNLLVFIYWCFEILITEISATSQIKIGHTEFYLSCSQLFKVLQKMCV